MGAFLDKPMTDKRVETCEGHGLVCAVADMQGWRVNMEDAHVAKIGLPGQPTTSFFAVFDGHGGDQAAKFSAAHVVEAIMKTPHFPKGQPESLASALRQGLLDLDVKLKQQPGFSTGQDRSGSTVITCLVTETHLIIGNAGDSRAVVASSVEAKGVRFGSEDHKPQSPHETARVESAGGFVNMGRVCGNLAVSRALGDFEFKDVADLPPEKQKISAEADTTILERQFTDEFLVLACDGIWDVMSNEQVVTFIKHYLEVGKEAHEIVKLLLDFCLDRGSKDNMTASIVLLPAHPKKVENKFASDDAAAEALKQAIDALNPEPVDPMPGVGTPPVATGNLAWPDDDEPEAEDPRTSPEPEHDGPSVRPTSPMSPAGPSPAPAESSKSDQPQVSAV
eukprot:m.177886 g.177886  ORF g.177886 m.177886 type:complete len:393 (-) comp17973_c2_seq1:163-1341(-)